MEHKTPEQLREELQAQLREAITAEQFFETNTGRLWTQIAELEITSATRDITSDKYEKDHAGYVKRLADLQAYKRILRKMQVAGSPIRKQKIKERLGEE